MASLSPSKIALLLITTLEVSMLIAAGLFKLTESLPDIITWLFLALNINLPELRII